MSTSSNGGVPVTTPGNPAPGHFALSAPFAALLEYFVIEQDGEDWVVAHMVCDLPVYDLDEGTGLDALLRAVINHDCT